MRDGVDELQRLNELRQNGKMQWSENAHAWAAQPRDVVEALAHAGFAEYKLAVTRSRRDRPPTGGVWQGLNLQTGAVASAIRLLLAMTCSSRRAPTYQEVAAFSLTYVLISSAQLYVLASGEN